MNEGVGRGLAYIDPAARESRRRISRCFNSPDFITKNTPGKLKISSTGGVFSSSLLQSLVVGTFGT